MLSIRKLLSRFRIEWRDKGPNCSRNFINIQCPMCKGRDPSFHLRIHEELGFFYCLRNSLHRGQSLGYLFRLMKIEFEGIQDLSAPMTSETLSSPQQAPEIRGCYADFSDASTSKEAIAYLTTRGFEYPKEVIEKFNLRVGTTAQQAGRWIGRLLIPLTVGWTGRAMRKQLEPRYLDETTNGGFFVFGRGKSIILVEGPVDAIKIGVVNSGVVVAAMKGGRISTSLLMYLREKDFSTIYFCPDNGVPPAQRISLTQELRTYCIAAKVSSVYVPESYKDHGEMPEVAVREWLYTL